MDEEKYKKLNMYLNDLFSRLQYTDSVYVDHIKFLSFLSKDLTQLFDYELECIEHKKELSCIKVIELARDSIEHINKAYLKQYDEMVLNGTLNFSYEKEQKNCFFQYDYYTKQSNVQINRCFNYEDVIFLVHEFFHLTNYNELALKKNRTFLTEFISIYYEETTRRYLKSRKDIDIIDLENNDRIIDFIKSTKIFAEYSNVLLPYDLFGDITKKTKENLEEFISCDSQHFDEHCLDFVKMIEKKESKFDTKTDINLAIADECGIDYRYMVGTMLAFYALDHCNKEDILVLNERLTTNYYNSIDIKDVLKTIGIEINSNTIDEAKKCIVNSVSFKQVVK